MGLFGLARRFWQVLVCGITDLNGRNYGLNAAAKSFDRFAAAGHSITPAEANILAKI
jgi:hypothetical protein